MTWKSQPLSKKAQDLVHSTHCLTICLTASYPLLSKYRQKKSPTLKCQETLKKPPKIPKWKTAVLEEMRALKSNDTWDFVDLSKGKCPVGCKWVFIVKYISDETIVRYKARLAKVSHKPLEQATLRHLHQ